MMNNNFRLAVSSWLVIMLSQMEGKPPIEISSKRLYGFFMMPGFKTLVSPYIYRIKGLESGTPKERAEALMNMYQNPSVKAIFDIGGGDLAIQLLEYLDLGLYMNPEKNSGDTVI